MSRPTCPTCGSRTRLDLCDLLPPTDLMWALWQCTRCPGGVFLDAPARIALAFGLGYAIEELEDMGFASEEIHTAIRAALTPGGRHAR